MGERRETNKRETRQRISDVATELFCGRGFDTVTLDEIAAAANVSKMTVFNYFSRKEDLMLDRGDDLLLLPFRAALRERPNGQDPVEALRGLVDRLREQKHPFARIHPRSVVWWRVVAASPALKARLHELEDEAAEGLALELAGPKPDGVARLMAVMIVLTVRTAREEAIRVLQRGGSVKKASVAFLALMDRGFDAVQQLSVAPLRQGA
ncbi:MAG: TetR/AcrR family transcriptional regulator [Polyangiaceae bacterium]